MGLGPRTSTDSFYSSHSVDKGLTCSLSRAVYSLKSKGKKYFNPKRMKCIPTDRNHGGFGGSMGRGDLERLVFFMSFRSQGIPLPVWARESLTLL